MMAARRKRSDAVRAALFVLAAPLVGGCAGGPLIAYDDPAPAQVLSTAAAAGIEDGRARFREIFCERFEAIGPPKGGRSSCGDYLHRLIDEPAAGAEPAQPPLPVEAVRFVVVPGFMSDAAPGDMRVLGPSIDRLAARGYRIEYLQVSGGGSSAYNAAHIAETFRQRNFPGEFPGEEKLVVIGYSKGTLDLLHFLVDNPDLAREVDAMVSYSGAVNGSALAEVFPEFLIDVAGFLAGSDAGDSEGFTSLKPSVQMRWLAEHPLPRHIRYFSLVSFTDRDNVSTALVDGYDRLSQINPRNDGQLISYDQVLPHSTLLGYANGDHWAVALPLEEEAPNFAGTLADRNVFPRDAILEALLIYVRESL